MRINTAKAIMISINPILRLLIIVTSLLPPPTQSFSQTLGPFLSTHPTHHKSKLSPPAPPPHPSSTSSSLQLQSNDDETAKKLEDARLQILGSRRSQIRSTLRFAESTRNFRLSNKLLPSNSATDSKLALTLTAGIVAIAAVTLRVGGRAALVSGLGLDFATQNPELKEGIDGVLDYAAGMDPTLEGLLFLLAWCFVKVFCFDAGGVILALSAGVLFGGVLKGAVCSAAAATVGSVLCFGLAKIESPIRKKALEVLEEYPSLRGIEKVVAKDGVKAILTLRLAPVLPIPIGLYNYIYGVTNVPLFDFAAGIFLGSMKPYLLDSYLGYFGKNLLDGASASDTQDNILLVALGVSVLVGVFASQLAGETWDAVQKEVEAEKKLKIESGEVEEDDGIMRNVMGMDLPNWIVGFQLGLKDAENRIIEVVEAEYNAKVWNYTKDDEIPQNLNPAMFPESPEISGKGDGMDIGQSFCDGLVLSPVLFTTYLKYADPLLDEKEKDDTATAATADAQRVKSEATTTTTTTTTTKMMDIKNVDDDFLLRTLSNMRSITEQRLNDIERKINEVE